MHRRLRGYIATGVLVAVFLTVLSGCNGRLLAPFEPEARLDPPPGRYREGIWVRPHGASGEDFYWSHDANAGIDEFERFGDMYVASDTTFRYYSISERGIRSRIIEAEYIIEDEDAPSISPAELYRVNARYYRFDLVWNTLAPWEVEDPDAEQGNPFDAITQWEDLEYAVYSSESNNIGSLSAAESNGRLEMSWLTIDDNPGDSAFRYFASRPGESRYFNVFVRDADGNASAYGTRWFATRPALSLYVGESDPTTDKLWVHDAVEQTFPNFAATQLAFADQHVKAVDLRRIDGDRYEDLAVVRGNGVQDFYRWYRAEGDGSFDETAPEAELYSEPQSPNPRTIRIADVTGDGKPELVFNTGLGDIQVSGSGGIPISAFAANAEGLTIGDIDNDGLNDIVSGGAAPGFENVRVWRNQGAGTFAEVTQPWSDTLPPVPGSGAPPTDLELADLDQDGNLDLVVAVASVGPPSVELAWGQGDGTFVEETSEALFWDLDRDTQGVAVADFDRDGDPDLFFANGNPTLSAADSSRVWLNDGDRTFVPGPQTGSASAAFGAIAADMNGDGWPDVVENHGSDIQLWILLDETSFDGAPIVFTASAPRYFDVGQIR